MTLRQLLERLPDPLESAVRATARAGRELYYDVRDAMARPAGDPVFVLGNQKSGTTAIAALLGLATGEPATLDLRRETRHDFYRRITSGEVHFDRLVRRNALDFSRRIVKEPNLTLFYPQLRRRFPAARFAFVLRDPRDNIRSILDRVELPGDLQRLEPGRLAHVDPGFALVMDGTWCGITSGGHYVDKLAARWNACLDVYESDPERMVLIRYEDFRSDKAGAIRRLADQLGLRAERDIADRVDQQFQSRGNRSARWETFFGPENLGRIEQLCGTRMERFGYPLSIQPRAR